MSEVKRYKFKGAAVEYVYANDFDRVTVERDAALGREAALQKCISTLELIINSGANRCDALQALLTAADERADVLEGLLRLLAELPGVRTSGLWERVVNALKPAEGGGDEAI